MPRHPRLLTTLTLLVLTAAALHLGSRWSLASPIAAPEPGPVAPPPVEPRQIEPYPLPPLVQPRLDVAFVLDTTGSMADEIAVVKAKIWDMAQALADGQPRPDIRFALVSYRDRGDAYVTQTFPFTRDVSALQRELQRVTADGGGDEPESVNEALHVGLHSLQWDRDPRVSRQIFLIGDAGPHTDYPQDYDYHELARLAAERRITIDTISCSGMAGFGIGVWQHVANTTNGRFEYLTYARQMQQTDGTVKTYLESGGRVYEPSAAVSEREWRKSGAAALERKGDARAVAPSSVAGAQVGDKRNNLDDVMVERLKERAATEQGVVYAAD